MKKENIIIVKSLKEQVYDYLREQIGKHNLRPGAMINMDATSKKLGISKTPLRDALIQLEMEGFVTIAPRRGIFVNTMTLEDIKNFYQVIGALENAALMGAFEKINEPGIKEMRGFNKKMKTAVENNNFPLFYENNLQFHDNYINLSENKQLIKTVANLKKRLYDFPARENWVREWEEASILEHGEIINLIAAGEARRAADYVQNVHWSFAVQERFIMEYYFPV
ncbi:MAG: GntR family transcriptional regulator [Candidatus Aminicenantes bacterium]|nr:GntR family transcriptional regulator [Candidatus Aminicenantes bacterium]